MKIINLTPHAIDVYGNRKVEDGPWISYPPSGQIARVAHIGLGTQIIDEFNDSSDPVYYELVEYGRLDGVPPKEAGTVYLVSLVAALAARGRDDLLAPYEEVRNDAGQMIGCRYLQRVC